MQMDFGNPVVPDEHEITAACETASLIVVQLRRDMKRILINLNAPHELQYRIGFLIRETYTNFSSSPVAIIKLLIESNSLCASFTANSFAFKPMLSIIFFTCNITSTSQKTNAGSSLCRMCDAPSNVDG